MVAFCKWKIGATVRRERDLATIRTNNAIRARLDADPTLPKPTPDEEADVLLRLENLVDNGFCDHPTVSQMPEVIDEFSFPEDSDLLLILRYRTGLERRLDKARARIAYLQEKEEKEVPQAPREAQSAERRAGFPGKSRSSGSKVERREVVRPARAEAIRDRDARLAAKTSSGRRGRRSSRAAAGRDRPKSPLRKASNRPIRPPKSPPKRARRQLPERSRVRLEIILQTVSLKPLTSIRKASVRPFRRVKKRPLGRPRPVQRVRRLPEAGKRRA